MMLGIYEDSEGLVRAREYGIDTRWQGLEPPAERPRD